MYQALYRSFRPGTFDELVGQEHIKKILINQIESGTVGHAYLFCGTRGTGKTTTARILAKALNCTSEGAKPCGECDACRAISAGTFVDVIEMDAASNNSVDDIRMLREEVNFPPAVGKTKVYIIDEAHMLSQAAFNAFLKTLEEPPANTVFILCTTAPNKLPATILSRCIRLDFRRVPESQLIELFEKICRETGTAADRDALALLAVNADGSVRDGLSLLDRCMGLSDAITRDGVLSLLGIAGTEVFLRLTEDVLKGNFPDALSAVSECVKDGKEIAMLTADWIEHIRNLMIVKFSDKPEEILNLSAENAKRLRSQAESTDIGDISRMIRRLSQCAADMRYAPKPRVLLELAIIELCGGKAEQK